MADTSNPMVPEHLPYFITAPGDTDRMFVMVTILVIVAIIALGVFYMKLHAIPDHMAHHASHNQLQLIGILTLIALLTHNNIFWLIALVIAAFNPPDFVTPLNSIARSLRRLAKEPEPEADTSAETTKHV